MPDDRVPILVDGQPFDAPREASAAVAAMLALGPALRTSVSGRPRGPLCGMGVCHECRLTIDGVLHQRSCLVPVKPGMNLQTDRPQPAASAEAEPTASEEPPP